jgi:hypothetical protein
MFGALELLGRWLGKDRLAAMAERVAGRSRMAAWQRVQDRLATLGPTEARGYVRARSMLIVKQETALLIEQEGAAIAQRRGQIEEAAAGLLVDMITAQIVQPRSLTAGRRAA